MSIQSQLATFAGGCFWCMVAPFANLPGVLSVFSGYAGGSQPNPTYEDYARKGYVEAVQVSYDPSIISYKQLLAVFWRQIDPTDAGGQFADRGAGYAPVIFYHTPEQKEQAEQSKNDLEKSGIFARPIATFIKPAQSFYKAEGYHQEYYKKKPEHYRLYRKGSGREDFLQKIWDQQTSSNKEWRKPSETQLKNKLSAEQYSVTQENKTEAPFVNEYLHNKRSGIYVDIVSGEPLFSSLDKYDSGSGWPSFIRPLSPENITQHTSTEDTRCEVRSKNADSHLGHLFNDGPAPTGKRYCINSAALRFIPAEDLEKEGYGNFAHLFAK